MKGGQQVIQLDYVILTQILPVANPRPDINLDNYKYQDVEVLLYFPLYNTKDRLYRGLKKSLVNIILRRNEVETFYSYGYDKKRSKMLFCVNKQPLPNDFQSTAVKKHISYLLDKKNL